ncbi:glyoxalase/bleomycin resistance protein/dioxygenase [Alcanivorax xiamenensis]|uniref:Glyoxalase/bleomycin resistance protein/dioxygenase n=1 Tax=Alcanivorax xiamenensis TaxID=1177156 RepID=A0ABQ6Y9A2_9GAMM|nr:VOC family protein [Alcanivorax xiamenensis]KAF0806296.1 glyoxalase/bleomycin resistance protein/dioxygenase [Alcanivorax xiamenensis]
MRKRLLLAAVVMGLTLWSVMTFDMSDYHAHRKSPLSYTGLVINSHHPERLGGFYLNTFGGQRVESGMGTFSLQTPGYNGEGPLLIIEKLSDPASNNAHQAFDHGYVHLCFEADDVSRIKALFIKNGGEIISHFDPTDPTVAFYGKDPEGNLVEVHQPFPTPFIPRTVARTFLSYLQIKSGMGVAHSDSVRFIHTNINTSDWVKTVSFYQAAFGTEPTGPKRDYDGDYIGLLTGVPGAAVKGRHVALPGYSAGGPTFEIFTYNLTANHFPRKRDQLGYVMTEFIADDLDNTVRRVINAGGKIEAPMNNTSVLVSDPGGNLIRLIPDR